MKQGHQRAHVVMWLVVAPALVAILFAALSARHAAPTNEALPATPRTEASR